MIRQVLIPLLARALCLCFGCTAIALAIAFASGCSADTFGVVLHDSGSQLDAFDWDGDTDAGMPDGALDAPVDGWDGLDGGNGGDGFSQPFRRVFITSKTYSPVFGSLAAGDAICASVASGASLGGKWAAWLSSSTTSAAARLEHAKVPYELIDGTVVASNWGGLISGALKHDIDHDENGAFVPYQGSTVPYTGIVATGTYSDGTAALGNTCNDWTSATGFSVMDGYDISTKSSSTYSWWTEINGSTGGGTCQLSYALYCLEQQ